MYVAVSNLSLKEVVEFSAFGIGSVKRFDKTGEIGYSLRVDVSTLHVEDAVNKLRALIEANDGLCSLLRNRDAQLAIVLEGSDKGGFPSLNFDAGTVAFLADLAASIDVDLYCFDSAGKRPDEYVN